MFFTYLPRLFLTAAATAVALLMGTAAVTRAHAAGPMVKSQAPGYFRLMLGDFEVTAINDGTMRLPMLDLLTNTTKSKVNAALKKNFVGHPVETSVNAYLINTGEKLVLVDAGAGGLFGPTLGHLVSNLKAAGYQPEQVDHIVITHMHADHVGGLMADGKMTFPNATVHIDQHDTELWLSTEKMNAAPEGSRGSFLRAMASANPYVQAGKVKTFSGATEFTTGIRANAAYGHTPGHSVIEVESKNQKLVLWGDMIHVAAVQFEDPTVTITFDTDSPAAMRERQKAYAAAAKGGYLIGAAHISFPGLGYVRTAPGGKGYQFVPVNYTTLK